MIAFIQGNVVEKQATQVIVQTGGIGYAISISLHTFSQIGSQGDIKILTHLIVKEDSHTLYGFMTEEERQLFVHLISVSGVGPNTARLILSSLEPITIKQAIVQGDDLMFKKVKGVGPKTAQRIIIDLKDKLSKDLVTSAGTTSSESNYHVRNEAVTALLALGFAKAQVDQAFKNMPEATDPKQSLEELIKIALKKLA